MAVPAPKLLELRDELIAGRVSEIRLQQIVGELKSVVKNGDASLLALAHEALGIAYIMKNRVDDALREHRIACDLAPNDGSIRHNYAVTLRRAGHLMESLDKNLEALELPGAETAVVLSNAATTLADLGEYDEAVRFMERALELLPGTPYAEYLAVAKNLAHVGFQRDAIDLTAHYLRSAYPVGDAGADALSVLRQAPAVFFEQDLHLAEDLRWGIEYALAAPAGSLGSLQRVSDARGLTPMPTDSSPLDEEFEGTRSWRDDATKDALTD